MRVYDFVSSISVTGVGRMGRRTLEGEERVGGRGGGGLIGMQQNRRWSDILIPPLHPPFP